mmetsp:Transcript_20223/g.52607  ORF Transcript_20223/g.52607 Transcript_20223/m.52607 type:complete len:245 (+) Transcript_20223:142-876(+)
MGAAIEREATAVLKDAEQLARVDTIEELVALLVFTVIALLGIWVLYRLDSAPVWELAKIDEFTKAVDGDRVLFAGSWNPPHAGHVAILRALAKRHGHVYACVGHNAKKTYLVDAEERARLVRVVVDADPVLRGRVTVVATAGYVWREAKRLKCAALYRGVRSWRADGFSETILHVLNLVGPLVLGPCIKPVATRYLAADAAHGDCSSSEVRRRVLAHEPLEGLVPRAIRADVRRLYAKQGDKCA